MVSLHGSWSVPISYTENAGLELDLLAALLDKGTRKRDKLQISEELERVGASISFSAGSGKIHAGARCLTKDLPLVLDLIREQVEMPVFPARELELLKGRIKAQIRRQGSDPGAVCRNEMSRLLFGPDHPHREVSFEECAQLLEGLDVDSVARVHGSPESWKGLRLAVVGDVATVDPRELAQRLVIHEGDGKGTAFHVPGTHFLNGGAAASRHIPIPDRANLNVQLGHSVDVVWSSEDFLPLWVGVFILGGNFSSRLMSIVRDEKGLTYGIRSGLGHVGMTYGGAWTTSVTLSQERLEEGIAATKEVIDRFVREGITAHELDERIETLIGSYEVELATTAGLAGRLVQNISRGRAPSYLDTYPDTVRQLTPERVNAAVRQYLDPEKLSLVSAGTCLGD